MVYTHKSKEIKVFGVPEFEKTQILERLPRQIREKIPSLSNLARRVPGCRLGFVSDATSFTVKITLEEIKPDIGLSIYSSQSAFVYVGERQNSKFLGIVNPPNYETPIAKKEFYLGDGEKEITIFLPRNEVVSSVEIEIPDGCYIKNPQPYKYGAPALFYGSSITECAHAANPCASYVNLVCKHLDLDFYNFGFSGNCKGEIELADYINTLDISLLVYDYDHNAPSCEHLSLTHERFFKRIREKKPNLPIIMLTRPTLNYEEDEIGRREIIKRTYENAKNSGDENVYFVDGESYFKDFTDKEVAFTDGIHPTDLGFYKMAQVIEPIIKEALK